MADPIIIHVEEEEIILKETGRGIPGRDGQDGISPNFIIGEVNTVEPDQPAAVRKSGTQQNVILDFDIPKGEPGASGGGTWGAITGDIEDQTDLKNALDAKADAADLGGIVVRPDYTISTTDLTDGVSALETGKLYFYYE